MNEPEQSIYVVTQKWKPFDPEEWRKRPIDALYMIRRQVERAKPEPVEVEVLVPCPHCGQFQTMVVIQNE